MNGDQEDIAMFVSVGIVVIRKVFIIKLDRR